MRRNFNVPLLFLLVWHNNEAVNSQQATLYDNQNYGGDHVNVKVSSKCLNVFYFNDRTTSIKTRSCIRLFENGDCGGRSVDISAPGSDNLGQLDFNDQLTSVSDCSNWLRQDQVEIYVNTTDAPELAEFGRGAKKLMQSWFPLIENLIRNPAYKKIRKINVYFDPKYEGIAYAAGNRIVGSRSHFNRHRDDFAVFLHELTHVVQEPFNCPGWLAEGYAEWTRRWFYDPWTTTSKPDRRGNYTDGYTNTAWLLNYVNSAVTGKPMAYLLNMACQDGSYTDKTWKDLTGKTVDQLWEDMLNDEGYPWRK